jgi:anion-transporting  ArsA/GET3 family ATPase
VNAAPRAARWLDAAAPGVLNRSTLPTGLAHIFDQKRIIVCVGSGGVGKTTTAATIALEGARRGKKALVLTIDPARRLASSLGLKELGHDVQAIPDSVLRTAGEVVPGGQLSAMMLDQRRAFDEVVARYASDPEAVRRILANPIYGQIAGSLAGAQEYAALAKLEELERDPSHELLVVDTPPTAHALDFLDAPQKLSAAIDSPAIEWFRRLRGQEGSGWSVVGRSGAYVLKRLSKFVGTRFLDDLALFFTEFNDILGGFRQRAEATFSLLRRKDVGFVLVASPEPMAMREALSFHRRLVESGMPMTGFVVNRVHQSHPLPPGQLEGPAAVADALAEHPPVSRLGLQAGTLRMVGEALLGAHRDLEVRAAADRRAIDGMRAAAGADGTIVEVPMFDEDVHDLSRLAEVGSYLFR